MSSIAKTSISLSKKDLTKSRVPPVGSRNVVFYHKATVGDLSIDLLALTMPSSDMPNAVQAGIDELSGARLTINKKNLSLQSSTKGQLIQNLDYIVVDSMTISLIGPYIGIGTEYEEIFVGTINCAAISDLVVASSKNVVRSYTLSVGQTTLNLAQEFKVAEYPSENIGIVKLFVNGVLAFRNTGNSSLILDRDYREVDSGNGYGSTVVFNIAPVGIANEIIVDFGVQAITDFDAIGTIESLSGSVKKIADDLAVIAGTSANDYIISNPSAVERRGFGDQVLDHEARIDAVEIAIPLKADLNGSALNLFSVANAVSANNATALGQFDASFTANGYQKLPGGLIMQWGTTTDGITTTSFPIAFPNACLNVQYSLKDVTYPGTFGAVYLSTTNWTSTSFAHSTNATGIGGNRAWFAIGY
jgi:hypothetical protein